MTSHPHRSPLAHSDIPHLPGAVERVNPTVTDATVFGASEHWHARHDAASTAHSPRAGFSGMRTVAGGSGGEEWEGGSVFGEAVGVEERESVFGQWNDGGGVKGVEWASGWSADKGVGEWESRVVGGDAAVSP